MRRVSDDARESAVGKTLVPLPSHPSYPSAHSCLSSAGASVLAALFPVEARQFEELIQQSGESRIAAGLQRPGCPR